MIRNQNRKRYVLHLTGLQVKVVLGLIRREAFTLPANSCHLKGLLALDRRIRDQRKALDAIRGSDA